MKQSHGHAPVRCRAESHTPEDGLLLKGGLAATPFSRPTWRWPVGGTKPVDAGAEDGALP